MITPYSNTISVTTLEALLLDDYSGAAAAYSLRLLSSTYTGDAIRVRRASDNTEQDIGFVNNELDTSTLITFCSGTNGFVKTWYDQSGNANDATQTTASAQPQIVSSGSVILENGKPALDFDGSDDYFVLSTIQNTPSYLSIINIFNHTNAALPGVLFGHRSYSTPLIQLTAQTNVETRLQIRSTSTSIQSLDISTSVGQKIAFALYNNVTPSHFLAIDSTNTTTNNTSFVGKIEALNNYIGATNAGSITAFMDGTMQELIVYTTDQSSNRTGIETNINDFYSIY